MSALPHGEITSAVLISGQPKKFGAAITGGTRDYARVRGRTTVEHVSQTDDRVTFYLDAP